MAGRRNTEEFRRAGLRPELVNTLSGLGYEEPTPIQREAIPPLLDGRDLLGPGRHRHRARRRPSPCPCSSASPARRRAPAAPRALVLVPTRELAMQVAEAIHRYGRRSGVRVLPIYGGQAIEPAAPRARARRGRGGGHARAARSTTSRRGTLDRSTRSQLVVLDEADEMLDMGFAEDLEAILQATPAERQTALFSATMPPRIDGASPAAPAGPGARRRSRSEQRPRRAMPPRPPDGVHRAAAPTSRRALGRVLDVEAPGVGASSSAAPAREVDELTEALQRAGYRAEALHGGMTQEQRDRVMRRFRDGRGRPAGRHRRRRARAGHRAR